MNNWTGPEDEGTPLGAFSVPPPPKRVSTEKCPLHRFSEDSSCRLCFPIRPSQKSASLPPLALGTLPEESSPVHTTALETKARLSWRTKPVAKLSCMDLAFRFKDELRLKRPQSYQFNELAFASALRKFRTKYDSCPEQELKLITLFFSNSARYIPSFSATKVGWLFVSFAQKNIGNMPMPKGNAQDQEKRDEEVLAATFKAMGL